MVKKYKICFINTSKLWGGGESWQFETIMHMKHEFEIVSVSNPDGQLFGNLINASVSCEPIRVGRFSYLNPFKIAQAFFLFKRIAPDAIMFNTANDLKLFSFPAKWAGIKKRIYRRDNGRPITPHLLNRLLLSRGITHFSPCSNFISRAALTKKHDLVDESKIKMIYNSISLTHWDQLNADTVVPKDDNVVTFGCIGRLSSEKGQLFLPEIARELAATRAKFRILIAGKGPLEQELIERIKEEDVGEYIELLGFVESNKGFLESIDCLLIPSHWEGLPTVAIEAMALEKPVIAFNVAGNPEVVIDNETGLLVEGYDTKLFAEKMRTLIDEPASVISLGKAGRRLVQTTFSREITSEQLYNLFRE